MTSFTGTYLTAFLERVRSLDDDQWAAAKFLLENREPLPCPPPRTDGDWPGFLESAQDWLNEYLGMNLAGEPGLTWDWYHVGHDLGRLEQLFHWMATWLPDTWAGGASIEYLDETAGKLLRLAYDLKVVVP